MSCACENSRLAREKERIRRLAKSLAVMEDKTVILYRNDDGSFGFCPADEETDKQIIEYLTPY